MSQETRILILEDVKADAELLERELRQGGLNSARCVKTEEEFRKALEEFKPDLILSDYCLPGFEGSLALALAKEKLPEIPFIYVSGSIGEERAIAALRSGATDYVLKDHRSRLVPTIMRALREVRERAERGRLEAELLQSEKMASVGLLIGGVAHELNNPLTAILGHVQLLLLETLKGTPLHKDLSLIERETIRCSRLIKSLLAFARKHEHQLRESDPNNLVREILELKTYDLRRAGITLVQELAEDLPPILVDPHQIQQVLLNLLNNAEQAMEKTKGTVRVRTRLEAEKVLLLVEDTGPGISPENLERIFQPFFTTKEPGKGTGLGLSICSKIVKDHEGTFTVESKPGEGARFTISLPAAKAHAPAGERRLSPEGAPRRVLVIDDQAEVLEFISRVLKPSGWDVRAFSGAREALDALRKEDFDAVISDFHMPEMDGEKFCREALALRPELEGRFILLTGQAYLESARPFAQAARIPVLVKPFDLEEFRSVLAAAIGAQAPVGGGR